MLRPLFLALFVADFSLYMKTGYDANTAVVRDLNGDGEVTIADAVRIARCDGGILKNYKNYVNNYIGGY